MISPSCFHPQVTAFIQFESVSDNDNLNEGVPNRGSNCTSVDALIYAVHKDGSNWLIPVSALQKALEINLLGVYRVNKHFLPMLLQRKGRIITLSSEVGRRSAAPFNGIYSISKYALEAYSDALRRELAFLDMKVIKIQPGPFKTSMTKNAEQLFIEAQKNSIYFNENLAKGIPYLPRVYKNAHDPVYVAKTIMKALNSPNPKTAYSIKPDIPRMMLELLPVKWADKLIKKLLS